MKNYLMLILAVVLGGLMFAIEPISFSSEYSSGINAAIGLVVGFGIGLYLNLKK